MAIEETHTPLRKWQRIGIHVLFWLISLSFFWFLFSRNSKDVLNTAIFIAILSPVAIFITYFFNYRLIPAFLVKGDYFRFTWYSLITGIVGLWITLLGGIFIWIWRAEFNLGEINANTLDIPMLVAALFFVVFMGISAKLMRINFQIQVQRNVAEKERLLLDNQFRINELKLLKDQLNPHFLFNTLNNLYGLTLEKSEKAPDLVMRLSNMLDYMLYRTNKNKVPLKQEIEMIQNYVSIEQHRFEGKFPISFEVKGRPDELEIAPLLFLPLVENCFKHGIRKSIAHAFVKISIQINENSIIFTSSNSFQHNNEVHRGGIGIENLSKRLEMLYPNAYDLEIEAGDLVFKTVLSIKLNSLL